LLCSYVIHAGGEAGGRRQAGGRGEERQKSVVCETQLKLMSACRPAVAGGTTKSKSAKAKTLRRAAAVVAC